MSLDLDLKVGSQFKSCIFFLFQSPNQNPVFKSQVESNQDLNCGLY